MGKGGNSNVNSQRKAIPWAEIQKHVNPDDRWIVIDSGVYDVTRWQRKHPGGARILSHFAGADATVSASGYA